ELLGLFQRGDLREDDQHVDRAVVRGYLLGDLRRRAVVDQVAGLRPQLTVVAQDVVGGLVERCLRIVADVAVREAGEGYALLPLLRERLADPRRSVLHRRAAGRPEDETVGNAGGTRDGAGRHRTHPDGRCRLLDGRRTDYAVLAVRRACIPPDRAHAPDLGLEPLGAAVERRIEHLVVVLATSLRDAEREPAARQLVDDGSLLRDEYLVPWWNLEDRRREPDALRHACDSGERDERVPRVVVRLVDRRQGGEPRLLRRARPVQHQGTVGLVGHRVRQSDSESHPRLLRRFGHGTYSVAASVAPRRVASRAMSEMKRRMLAGELYLADDPVIAAEQGRAHGLQERYNATRHDEQELRDSLLRERLGDVGGGAGGRPPLFCEYGTHISIGARTFANYDCVMLDVAEIRIGAACQLAPRVQLLTPTPTTDTAL